MSNRSDLQNNSRIQPASHNIGSGNARVFDSFNAAVIHSPGAKTIASFNANATSAFTEATIVVAGGLAPADQTVSTTIASNNRNLKSVFERAEIRTPATQSSRVASGNDDISNSFQGFRVECDAPQVVGSINMAVDEQVPGAIGDLPPPYPLYQTDPLDPRPEVGIPPSPSFLNPFH